MCSKIHHASGIQLKVRQNALALNWAALMQKLKIYGERHTSSNYLSRLLALNLDVQELSGTAPKYLRKIESLTGRRHWFRDRYFARTFEKNLGWKHTLVPHAQALADIRVMRSEGVHIVTLTKNPYSWLLSMFRNPYHEGAGKGRRAEARDLSLEAFLQQPWTTLGRENAPAVIDSPIQLWNLKNAALVVIPEQMALHLTTEQTIVEPEQVVRDIAQRFAIPMKQAEFVNFEASTKNKPGHDGTYYRDYYLNEVWREEFSNEAIAIVNKRVDQDLMHRFGYARL